MGRLDRLLAKGEDIRGRFDGWANILTGLSRGRDKRTSAAAVAPKIWQGPELDILYHGSDLIRTIIDLPANEMVREWVEIKTDDVDGEKGLEDEQAENEAGVALLDALEKLDAQSRFGEAEAMARLTGGAVIMLGADDGSEDVREPLKEDNIQSVQWLEVFDRFDLDIVEVYHEIGHPKFGLPSVYRITRNSTTASILSDHSMFGDTLVHETRLLIFRGHRTTRRRRDELDGWDESVVTAIEEVVRDLDQSFSSLAHLMLDMSQAVYKMHGLAQLLNSDQDDIVLKRLQFLDLARSVVRAIPLDTDEDYIRQATPLTGVAEALDKIMARMASAARMPIMLLFGESSPGMQSTGQSDIRFFYDNIRSQQRIKIGAPLRRLGTLIYKSKEGPTNGVEPDSWMIEFIPLWSPTPKEKADEYKTTAEADAIYMDRGVLSPHEVAAARFGPGSGADIIVDLEDPDRLPPPTLGDPATDPAVDPEADPADPNAPPPDPEADPPTATGAAGDAPMPEEAVDPTTALNGAQVTALIDVISRVATGDLPRDTGVAIIAAAFPLDNAAADVVMGTVGRTFFVEKQAPPPFGGPNPDPDDDPDDDPEDGNTGHESGHDPDKPDDED